MLQTQIEKSFVDKNAIKSKFGNILEKVGISRNCWELFWEFQDFEWEFHRFRSSNTVHIQLSHKCKVESNTCCHKNQMRTRKSSRRRPRPFHSIVIGEMGSVVCEPCVVCPHSCQSHHLPPPEARSPSRRAVKAELGTPLYAGNSPLVRLDGFLSTHCV